MTEKININKASYEELMHVQGIGRNAVEEIIRYREQYGKFQSVNDLKNLKGVNEKLVTDLKNLFTV